MSPWCIAYFSSCNVLPSSHRTVKNIFFSWKYIKDPLNLIRVLQTCRLHFFSVLISKEFGCCVIYNKFTYKSHYSYNIKCAVYIQFFFVYFSLYNILCDENYGLKNYSKKSTADYTYIPKSSKSQQTKHFIFFCSIHKTINYTKQ